MKNILLLCNYQPLEATMVTEHINSLYKYSNNNIYVYSDLVRNSGQIDKGLDVNLFDCIIIHYSIFLEYENYISQKTKNKIRDFAGLKGVFIQDEYRAVNCMIDNLNEMKIDILFTCVPTEEIEKVYPKDKLPGLRKVNVLTGYVSEYLSKMVVPMTWDERKIDVSYRGRVYPAWFGRLGREKWIIAKEFKHEAKKYKLRTDISCKENKRLYNVQWVELIRNSKAVLGVESGSSVFDFEGKIGPKANTVEQLYGKKETLKRYQEIREKYFKNEEDSINLAQISPRVLEAIALRTLCILFEGEYSGILKPWVHYIPLKKDFSNISEVVHALKNKEQAIEIVANAYSDIACNEKYSYKSFVKKFDCIIDEEYVKIKRNVCKRSSYVKKFKKRTVNKVRSKQMMIDTFYEKYPWYIVEYPHMLNNPNKRKIVNVIPSKLKRIIKKYIQ